MKALRENYHWIFLLIAGTGLIGGCDQQQAAAPPQRPPTPVVVVAAVTKDVPSYIDEIGKTAARESVMIQPQVIGKIMDIHFQDGANLKKGDLLFAIDPRPYEAALKQAEAAVAQADADSKWSTSELKRMQGLAGTGAVSVQDLESKQNTLAVAEAKVAAAQAAVMTAKLNLEYCTITSPIDGRAGQRMVDPGNVVNTGGADGGTKLLTIQRLDPIYADFTIAEQELSRVREQMAKGTLKTEVWLPNEATPVMREGDLTFLDNSVGAGSGTIRLRATLPNKDSHFWPGQFVQVRLVLKVMSGAVLVPATAQQVSQDGPYLYVVKADSTAERRLIQIGQRQGDMVVVEKGVAAGEKVVTVGQNMVAPGAKVMPTEAPVAAPTSQPTVPSAEGAAGK